MPTHVIAMLNQKGGVGKTTTAVNLGAALAEAGRRVCLIDLDPQAHLTLHLGIDVSTVDRTVYDLLIEPACQAEDALIRQARDNLDAILAEVDLAGAETELAGAADRHDILHRKLSPIVDDYDVVLIDCPPSLGLLTLNALALATEIFVPMQAHFLALQGVGRLLETVGLVCRSVNPRLRVTGIILCMHEGQTTLAREVVADLDAFFESCRDEDVPWRDCQVLRPPIRRNIKLAEAPSFGKTIFDYEPWCPGALDYRKLADRVLKRWSPEADDGQAEDAEAPEPEMTAPIDAPEQPPDDAPGEPVTGAAQEPTDATDQQDIDDKTPPTDDDRRVDDDQQTDESPRSEPLVATIRPAPPAAEIVTRVHQPPRVPASAATSSSRSADENPGPTDDG